jgi:putative ABC transport system permease protein
MALDQGVNWFDTADSYAGGDSETLLGRALGARRADVLGQFLVEAVVLSSLGGLLGTLLGVGVTAAVAAWTGWATDITAESVLLALAFAIGVGVFFGWYPARRAAALDPIEALRFQ